MRLRFLLHQQTHQRLKQNQDSTPFRTQFSVTEEAHDREPCCPTIAQILSHGSLSHAIAGSSNHGLYYSRRCHSAPNVPIPKRGVDYRGKVVLAPMVRSGELPCRLLALKYGADLVWGPETVDRSMIGCTMKTNPRTGCLEWSRVNHGGEVVLYRIDPVRESDRLIYQIGTNSPERAVQAAKLFAEHVAGFDVNAGCPKSFSTDGGMGAALLRTPDLLASILKALVEEVGKPYEVGISVKIRLLETPELTSDLVNKLCETGITGLTIHCRTTPMRPRERALRDQLRMIGDICRKHGVACLMNGDVYSYEDGISLAEEYGVDGAMIATAAEANPSVFRKELHGGKAPWQELVPEYLKFAMGCENKFGNTRFTLSQLMPGKSPLYQKCQMSKTYSEVLGHLEIKDEDLVKEAKEVDHILGLDSPAVRKHDIKKENKRRNKELQEAAAARRKESQAKEHQSRNKRQRSHSPREHRKRKTEAAAENAGLAEGRKAMAMAA
jgi:tRNA-dihydrouridine synthase 2